MSEGETEGPVAQPPPLGGQTADASLIPPSADELLRRSDLGLFVGPNVEKFVSVFGSTGVRRRRRGTCWPGFFFPLAWFMYRKMYGWAALACALPIFAGVLDFGCSAAADERAEFRRIVWPANLLRTGAANDRAHSRRRSGPARGGTAPSPRARRRRVGGRRDRRRRYHVLRVGRRRHGQPQSATSLTAFAT